MLKRLLKNSTRNFRPYTLHQDLNSMIMEPLTLAEPEHEISKIVTKMAEKLNLPSVKLGDSQLIPLPFG